MFPPPPPAGSVLPLPSPLSPLAFPRGCRVWEERISAGFAGYPRVPSGHSLSTPDSSRGPRSKARTGESEEARRWGAGPTSLLRGVQQPSRAPRKLLEGLPRAAGESARWSESVPGNPALRPRAANTKRRVLQGPSSLRGPPPRPRRAPRGTRNCFLQQCNKLHPELAERTAPPDLAGRRPPAETRAKRWTKGGGAGRRSGV